MADSLLPGWDLCLVNIPVEENNIPRNKEALVQRPI